MSFGLFVYGYTIAACFLARTLKHHRVVAKKNFSIFLSTLKTHVVWSRSSDPASLSFAPLHAAVWTQSECSWGQKAGGTEFSTTANAAGVALSWTVQMLRLSTCWLKESAMLWTFKMILRDLEPTSGSGSSPSGQSLDFSMANMF